MTLRGYNGQCKSDLLPGKKARVAFVNTHPIQYLTPLYAHINRSIDIEAVPLFLCDHGLREYMDPGFGRGIRWDVDLLAGFEPVFLPGASGRRREKGLGRMFAPQIWREIRRGGYDAVVVHGHAVPANHIALAAAKSAGLPVFHRTETHLGLTRSRWKQAVRAAVMPRYYAMFDGMLAIGAANRDFYRAMHVPERRISLFPYTVDNERFARAARLDAAERRELRRRLGLTGDRPAVLFAGKFLPRKRPDDLIRAAHRLAAEGVEFDLVIAGGGEMDAELRRLAAEAAAPRVHFPGFFNQSEMPKLLAACDLFVLPSRDEPWGLIINEAMCAALPIVASRDIGAVRDLVFDGVNGQSFDGGDVQGLADALRPIIFDAGLRQEMGKASRDIISGWNYDRCEAGLREALSRAGVRGVSG